MLPLSISPDTASKGLRTLAPWNGTRLEMSPPPCCSVRTFTVNSHKLSISPPGPTYRCPFTEPFEGFKSAFGHSSGFTTDSPAPGVDGDFPVPASPAICFNRFTVDGHVADRDCIQLHLDRPPLLIVGVATRVGFLWNFVRSTFSLTCWPFDTQSTQGSLLKDNPLHEIQSSVRSVPTDPLAAK